jgi:predicted phage terminase large subunit-like protein
MAAARDELIRAIEIESELTRRKEIALLQDSFSAFVRWAWHILEPGRELKWNWSVELICDFLQAFAYRKFHRGIINIPPRGMKSTLVSVCFPVWVWIQDRDRLRKRGEEFAARWVGNWHQFLCLANDAPLALRDAVQARNLMEHEDFIELFGNLVQVPQGQNEKSYYRNTANGHRNSRPIQGSLTGKGGDTILIDDPHDAEKAMSDADRQNVLDSYAGKVTSRMNDQANGGILIIMQRLHERDLAGFVRDKDGDWEKTNKRGWVSLVLPMEYELDEEGKAPINTAKRMGFHDPRTKKGELLWPERFPLDAVKRLTSDLQRTSGVYGATAQMQQTPSPSEGGILRKSWWQKWPDDKSFPICEHIFLSWDTAYTEKDLKEASFSARTAWGVFWNEQAQAYNLILLHCWADQLAYPDLREKAQSDTLEYNPDAHLIEKKASGLSLIQDLRRAGKGRKRVRLRTYLPDRDKVARAHATTSLFSAGMIWAPNRSWADKTIDACGVFPNGAPPSADITDTVTQAILYLKNGWWVEHPDDAVDDSFVGSEAPNWDTEDGDEPRRRYGGYYG